MTTLQQPGTNTSIAEITNISSHGIWIYTDDQELFMSYNLFPWFKNKRINEVLNVKKISHNHLYWRDLDIDLTLDMIKNPTHYPLEFK